MIVLTWFPVISEHQGVSFYIPESWDVVLINERVYRRDARGRFQLDPKGWGSV